MTRRIFVTGCWGVFVYVLDVHVTIVGRHVALPEISLVAIDSPAPSIHDETARMWTGRLPSHTVLDPHPGTP